MKNILSKSISILILFLVNILYAQSCRELYEDYTEKAIQLLEYNASLVQWLEIRDVMKKLKTDACADEFTEDEERYILEHLVEVCKKVSDFKQYFSYRDELSQLIEDSNETNYLEYASVEWDEKTINKHYGTLRVKLDLEGGMTGMKEMAVLKSKIGGEIHPIKIRFEYPENAIYSKKLKNQSMRRLEFLQLEIARGNLELNFDAYDHADNSFYFEIPYIPLLKASKNPSQWYAITFDNKKRYRINYNIPDIPLTIKPEENWVLLNRLPEKWIKLTFDKSLQNVEFRSVIENRILKYSRGDYIKIDQGEYIDYYLPSDQTLKINLNPRRGVIYTVSNIFYRYLFPVVIIIAGVSVL